MKAKNLFPIQIEEIKRFVHPVSYISFKISPTFYVDSRGGTNVDNTQTVRSDINLFSE